MSNSFVFYETFTKQLKSLDAETRCRFYDAIAEYGLYETEPDFKGIEASVWLPMNLLILDNALNHLRGLDRRIRNEYL